MDNLSIFNSCSTTPDDAKKEIFSGEYSGLTGINPMYRIKKLTELFGPVGIGWRTEIVSQQIKACSTGAILYMEIALYIKSEGEWSFPIQGFGGISLKADGIEDIYKAAFTDALGNACKNIGIGADVYWNEVNSKYDADKAASESINFIGATDVPAEEVVEEEATTEYHEPKKQPDPPANPQAMLSHQESQEVIPVSPAKPTVPVPQTVEEARNFVFTSGRYAGKKVGEVLLSDRRTVEWYATKMRESPSTLAAVTACRMVLG